MSAAVDQKAAAPPASEPPPATSGLPADDQSLQRAVQHNLLMVKLFYFLTFAGSAASSPYNGVFLSSRGFAPSQVGLIASLFPLLRLIVVPYVTYWCDRVSSRSLPVLITCFVLAGTATVVNGLISVESTAEEQRNSDLVLLLVIACFLTQAIFKGPIGPVGDQIAMVTLPADRKKEWGQLRVYGAYGWGLGAPLFAQLIAMTNYTVSFFFYPLLGLAGVYAVNSTTKLGAPKPATKKDFGEVMRFLLQPEHRRTLLLLIFSTVMGCGLSIISTFLFVFLKEELDAPQVLLGLTITGMVVVEIPIFKKSEWLHRTFTDQQLLLLSLFSWSIRVVGYSYIGNPWLVLLFEPLHGMTFGCSWLAAVHALTTAFPEELTSSAFGLLHASVDGIGTITGTSLGGLGYDILGPRVFYRLAASVMALFALLYYFLDKRLARLYPDHPPAEKVPPTVLLSEDAIAKAALDDLPIIDVPSAILNETVKELTNKSFAEVTNKSFVELVDEGSTRHAKLD